MSTEFNKWLESRLDRLANPDGRCFYCERLANRLPDVGPIEVQVTEPFDPLTAGPETVVYEFCCWECIADHFAIQAGRRPQGQRN